MLPSHVVGGGRPTAAVPKVTQEEAEDFIKSAQEKGFSFNYLFNAPCLDAREFKEEWRKQFLEHLDWVLSLDIKEVTVSVPYLIEVMKKRYPDLKVCVSSYARVNSLRRASYFEDLGADDVTIDPTSGPRNIKGLKAMAEKLNIGVTIIANGFCLFQCPYAEYHGTLMGHSSQEGHPSGGYYEEYPFYNCTLRKLTDPTEIVRAGFLRPEDIKQYEKIGIKSFKLVDRTRPTDWIEKTYKAYVSGKYKGDLLQILSFPHGFLIYLYKMAGMKDAPVFPKLLNQKLDGFLEEISNCDCLNTDCDKCDICRKYAERAVEMPEGVEKLAAILEGTLSRMNFG